MTIYIPNKNNAKDILHISHVRIPRMLPTRSICPNILNISCQAGYSCILNLYLTRVPHSVFGEWLCHLSMNFSGLLGSSASLFHLRDRFF